MGSGDLLVLATPALVSMMENVAMSLAATSLSEADTTVGSEINTTHERPSAVGATIEVTATLIAVEGRKMSFSIEASDANNIIGRATHTRFVVNREKFMSKLPKA